MGSADDVIKSAAARGMLLVFPLPKVGGAVGGVQHLLTQNSRSDCNWETALVRKMGGWVRVGYKSINRANARHCCNNRISTAMAMLFSDPLAFLPSSSSTAAAVLPPLFPQWNVTSSTFNNHQHLIGSDGDDASSLDRLHSQVMDSVDLIQSQQQSTATGKTSSSNTRNRSNGRRRIKSQPQQQQQQQEPIAIMDLDHPLNSWLTTKTSEKEQFLGPLATRDGTEFPILPQFTYTALSNGSLIQIPVRTAVDLFIVLQIRRISQVKMMMMHHPLERWWDGPSPFFSIIATASSAIAAACSSQGRQTVMVKLQYTAASVVIERVTDTVGRFLKSWSKIKLW